MHACMNSRAGEFSPTEITSKHRTHADLLPPEMMLKNTWVILGLPIDSCILSPCLFNLYAEYITRNAGLEEAQAGIKIAGRNINNLRYTT